mgnify:CR=1 FL=1
MQHGADFIGTDRQEDTYFKCGNGRLKLREGNIENFLIFYERNDIAGPKKSNVELYGPSNTASLKNVLSHAYGTRVIVKKSREIFFIDHVKFHIDKVDKLGTFVEIEAIDKNNQFETKELEEKCNYFLSYLNIAPKDLIENSYSDILLKQKNNGQ